MEENSHLIESITTSCSFKHPIPNCNQMLPREYSTPVINLELARFQMMLICNELYSVVVISEAFELTLLQSYLAYGIKVMTRVFQYFLL
jgi:hypothetical protein